MKKIVLTVCLAVLLAVPAVRAQDNDLGGSAGIEAVFEYTDTGWSDTSGTSDCVNGWGRDQWQFTNSAFGFLTVTVEDCCIVGDYYEIWIDGVLEYVTPNPGYVGTISDPGDIGDLSVGSVTVWVAPGVHTVEIRDALLETLTPEQLEYMCPAGYTVTGEWEPIVEFTKVIPDAPWEFGGFTWDPVTPGGDGDDRVEPGEDDWVWRLWTTLTNVSGEAIQVNKVHDRLGGDLEWEVIGWHTIMGSPEIYTKGNTEKVFVNWYDGFTLGIGESVNILIAASPDINTGRGTANNPDKNGNKNPKDGHPEYTSLGIHELNSGTWFEGYIGDTYIEGQTNSVSIEVVPAD